MLDYGSPDYEALETDYKQIFLGNSLPYDLGQEALQTSLILVAVRRGKGSRLAVLWTWSGSLEVPESTWIYRGARRCFL